MAEWWARPMWRVIHQIGLTTDLTSSTDSRRGFVDFMNSLKKAIPCTECRLHYTQYIDSHPYPSVDTKTDKTVFFEYTVDLHNSINKRLGKKTYTLDEAWKLHMDYIKQNGKPDAMDYQTKFVSKSNTNDVNDVWIIALMVLVLIVSITLLCMYICQKRNKSATGSSAE